MIQVLKTLTIILLLNSFSFASEKLTIQELISIASTYVKQPVVLDRNLDKTLYIYTQRKLTKENVNNILFEVLKNNGLRLTKTNNYYLLEAIKKEVTLDRSIRVHYLDKNKIESIMKHYNQKYIFINRTVLFSSLLHQYQRIKSSLELFDKTPKQKIMKITVLETNINKLKEFGTKFNLTDVSKNLWNVSLGNTQATLSPNAAQSYGIELKALVTDGVSKIVTNPTVVLRDGELTNFDITRTIPFSNGQVTTGTGDDEQTKTEYDYKPIGLKLNVNSTMLTKSTDIDIQLTMQDIISNNSNVPITSDKVIKQKIKIDDNKLVMLSGFKKNLKVTNDEGIPLLKDIPYLGYFFKWELSEDVEIVLQILIEISDEEVEKSETRELTTISRQRNFSANEVSS
jgi:general secretion pathway protein D